MPQVVPQSLKSLKTIALQPEKMSNRIEAIMCMDLTGKGTGEIADALGMSVSRISIIKNSPMYAQEIATRRSALLETFREKQADRLVNGDPVEQALKDAALNAAKKKIDLMENGKSEFVQAAAAGDILDRAGYKAFQEKTRVSVEITEKMGERFEAALRTRVVACSTAGSEALRRSNSSSPVGVGAPQHPSLGTLPGPGSADFGGEAVPVLKTRLFVDVEKDS